jgi:hypothetical protein
VRCSDWETGDALTPHLDDVVTGRQARHDLTIRIAKDSLGDFSDWP